jgi:hypothetical protein
VAGDLEAALLPFRAAIAAGVKAVMTATWSSRVSISCRPPEPPDHHRSPARGARFDGLVVTDALEMRAISGGVGVEEAGVQALAAGVDALCVGHDLHEETVAALIAAISEAARSVGCRSSASKRRRGAWRRRRRGPQPAIRPARRGARSAQRPHAARFAPTGHRRSSATRSSSSSYRRRTSPRASSARPRRSLAGAVGIRLDEARATPRLSFLPVTGHW